MKRSWLAAIALAAPVFLVPASNPDLFWHLSAGKWIVENFSIPRADFLSFTRSGAPWHDFEWLAQVLYYGVYAGFGFAGLWLLKVALLAAAGALFVSAIPRERRPSWLVAWAACMFVRADIRPELFSLLFFTLLTTRTLSPAATLATFALWSNLHAGFLFGLPLLLTRPRLLAAALAGSLCNPYGWGPYLVALQHADVAYITEWRPSNPLNPYHWPFFALLALYLYGRKLADWASLYALAALRHARLALFFEARALPELARRFAPPAWAALPYAAWLMFLAAGLSWSAWFDHRSVPLRAARFIEEAPRLKLYNEWEWGGYLAWRIPGYKVFWDGRYLFHDLLNEAAEAARSAENWQAFLDKHGLQGALLENRRQLFPSVRVYKDGSSKPLLRPWYLTYMPRERWALVYFDDKTLFFVRRDAVPKAWLKAHEYKWLRPHDEEAFADARRRGEIPDAELQAEAARHVLETP